MGAVKFEQARVLQAGDDVSVGDEHVTRLGSAEPQKTNHP